MGQTERKKDSLWAIQRQREGRGTPQSGRAGSLITDALPRLPSHEQVRQDAMDLEQQFQEDLIRSVLGRTVSEKTIE